MPPTTAGPSVSQRGTSPSGRNTLLVPSMHCPTCPPYITALLADLPISDLRIDLIGLTVSYLPPSSLRLAHKVEQAVVRALRYEGYDVEGWQDDGLNLRGVGWLECLSPRKYKRKRHEDEERRRRHVEHCAHCQAALPTDASSPEAAEPVSLDVRSTQPEELQLAETTLSIEGMTCSSCTFTISNALTERAGVTSANVSIISNSALVIHDTSIVSAEQIRELVDDIGYDATIVSSQPMPGQRQPMEKSKPKTKTTFSIEGMTCAACVHTVSNALSALSDVEKAGAYLTSNSAFVVHDSDIAPQKFVDEIEDLGFGAQVVRSEPFEEEKMGVPETSRVRVVTLKLEGLDCVEDITKVMQCLSALPVEVMSSPKPDNPLLKFSYEPSLSLTIRTLLDVLPKQYSARLHVPLSLSALSRQVQLRDFHRTGLLLLFSFILAIPTFIFGVVGMLLLKEKNAFREWCMAPVWGGANNATVILFCLSTPVLFFIAYQPFHRPAFISLQAASRRRPFRAFHLMSFGNMDVLVSLSISVSYFSSIGMMGRDIHAGAMGQTTGTTYFDSVVFLVFFVLIGRVIDSRARVSTGDAIAMLGSLKPEKADLVVQETSNEPSDTTALEQSSNSTEEKQSFRTLQIPVSHLDLKDHILLRPGSLPPADGIVVSGVASFDESSLTGESVPVPKGPGDTVYTGTTNLNGAIVIRVTQLGETTMLERIVRAVGDAQGRKAPVEMLADRITAVFVPIVIYLAVLVLILWLATSLSGAVPASYLAGSGLSPPTNANRVFFSFQFAISVLVVACPCGIGLAAPTAQAVGAGMAAKMGILAQGGGEAFQSATEVGTVVFDKTGTLTVGEAKVEDAEFLCDSKDEAWLRIAVAALEDTSTHPLATALKTFCSPEGGSSSNVELLDSREIAGRGARGVVRASGNEYDLVIGNEAFLREAGSTVPEGIEMATAQTIENWKNDGKSVVLVGTRVSSTASTLDAPYTTVALFSISDAPRPDTASSIAILRKSGKEIYMLSGDNEVTARAVARRVGIDEANVIAGVLPDEKAEKIRGLQARSRSKPRHRSWADRMGLKNDVIDDREVVLFCGDGLNDSAAIAAADVGVALGHGSQISVAAADFIILNSSLATLPSLLHLSSRVYRRQKQNFAWALIYNLAALPLAAGVFYPAGHTRLPPVWSALAMALSSISVVTSSLALRWGI